jgi:hypothetical protein
MSPTLARLHNHVLPLLSVLLFGAGLILVVLRRAGARGDGGDRLQTAYCPACRHVNPAAARFCAMCGQRLPPQGTRVP